MQISEFEALKAGPSTAVITAEDLQDKTPRTLIFGFELDRETFHVYLGNDGLIHVFTYTKFAASAGAPSPEVMLVLSHEAGTASANEAFAPSKRAYPESCDFEFCKLMQERGVNISFTTFEPDADECRTKANHGFAGATHEQGGIATVDLHDMVLKSAGFPQQDVRGCRVATAGLVQQAARELGVYSATIRQGRVTLVPAESQAAVLARAQSFLPKFCASLEIANQGTDDMFSAVFGYGHYIHGSDKSTAGGTLTVRASCPGGLAFRKSPDIQELEVREGGFIHGAILTRYEGFLMLATRRDSSSVELNICLYGDEERFVDLFARVSSLTRPVEVLV